MRILLRLTLLGVFAALGLGLAVVVVTRLPVDIARGESPAATTAPETPKLVDTPAPSNVPSQPAPAPPIATPPVDEAAPKLEEMRGLFEQSLERWTASYLPAMSRQFDKLKEAEEAAQKYSQRAQEAAEQVERVQNELPPRFRSNGAASGGAGGGNSGGNAANGNGTEDAFPGNETTDGARGPETLPRPTLGRIRRRRRNKPC